MSETGMDVCVQSDNNKLQLDSHLLLRARRFFLSFRPVIMDYSKLTDYKSTCQRKRSRKILVVKNGLSSPNIKNSLCDCGSTISKTPSTINDEEVKKSSQTKFISDNCENIRFSLAENCSNFFHRSENGGIAFGRDGWRMNCEILPQVKLPSTIRRSTGSEPSRMLHLFILLWIVLFFPTGQVTAVWWLPGGNSKLVNSSRTCQWARQVGGPQLEMCRRQPKIMKEMLLGIELGVEACQHALREYRWNCTQAVKSHFYKVMNQDTRETAFVHALTAAATTYQVTQACAKGNIPECECTNNHRLSYRILRMEAVKHNRTYREDRLRKAEEAFDWGGCDDNIEYGIMKSLAFLNFPRSHNRRVRGALKTKIKTHNQNAGRLVVKNYRRRSCHCHGLSGSCTMWTCWKVLPHFSIVRLQLRNRYNFPVRVVGGNDGKTLQPIRRRFGKKRKVSTKRRTRSANDVRSNRVFERRYSPKRRSRKVSRAGPKANRAFRVNQVLSEEDLVYSQKSPRFCSHSKKQGSYGTKGRLCEVKKRGPGSCRHLCCGRGYETVNVLQKSSCNCRFEYCCQMHCDTCIENVSLHYCR